MNDMDQVNIGLILHRLDEISKKQDDFNAKVEGLVQQMAEVKTIETTVNELKDWKTKFQETISVSDIKEIREWKARMDERVSPTQLDTLLKTVDDLKTFKTKATMIWVVIQAIMGIIVFFR